VDFSAALHKLSQRGYTIVLAHGAGPGQGVSLALSNAAGWVWQWPALARGQGLLPAREADWAADASPPTGPVQTGEGTACAGREIVVGVWWVMGILGTGRSLLSNALLLLYDKCSFYQHKRHFQA
jgi:hypothetical protein